jgi:L-2-hydroxyglutarate oxidase LhgO
LDSEGKMCRRVLDELFGCPNPAFGVFVLAFDVASRCRGIVLFPIPHEGTPGAADEAQKMLDFRARVGPRAKALDPQDREQANESSHRTDPS